MAGFDVAAARRWARPFPRKTLARRPDAALPFAGEGELAGQPLLLDTCVYINQMQGRAPRLVEQLIDTRQVNHSTAAVVEAVSDQIEAMPEHRVFAPDAEVLGRAALLAGILSRLQGYARGEKLKALADCVLFLQAQKLGFAVLTANVAEFDLLLQLVPTGRALLYRAGD
jgi:hypothetical protein